MSETLTPQAATDRLIARYDAAVHALRQAVRDFIDTGTLPDPEARARGLFAYPLRRVEWRGETPPPPPGRASGSGRV
ncbi:MAG: AMP nucleosidase, partial [Brevundimonas sp.]